MAAGLCSSGPAEEAPILNPWPMATRPTRVAGHPLRPFSQARAQGFCLQASVM
jgi:hypothetical protein